MNRSHPSHAEDPDETFMRRAIELAQRGQGSVEPNPMVGCVLVRDHQVIGEGFHQSFGGPHAEVEALHSLGDRDANGATAYVSLEPCCHHGKTPPCTDALIKAGIARVVVAMSDPFPMVDGGGLKQLRHAGIEVTQGVLEAEALTLAEPYLKRVRTGKPWVIAKWAMTLDGRIATVTGESQWISGESSRSDAHLLRSRVDAIAVGMGTVEADNPSLNARFENPEQIAPRIASRVVFCRNRLPKETSRLVTSADQIPLLLVVHPTTDPDGVQKLLSLGAEAITVQSEDKIKMVDQALTKFGQRSMTNLMIEGGGELLASFFEADQIDECHVYVAGVVVGGTKASGPIGGSGIGPIDQAPRFCLQSIRQFESDVKLVYRRSRG